jgi:hypothetical protein
MPSTDAPNWWADVQQEREDLTGRGGRRPAEDWLGEDIDFVPRRRMTRRRGADVAHERAEHATAEHDVAADADHPLHGVFVPTTDAETARAAADSAARAAGTGSRVVELTSSDSSRTIELTGSTSGSRTIELTMADDVVLAEAPAGVAHELAHLSAADDPFASPLPPAGARRTVQIKGKPAHLGLPSMAQRHRGRTASDRVGPRPDRIALWAVALGAILILLAAMTSSSQAATRAPRIHTPAASAHVVHVHHTAPVRAFKHR